MVALPTFATLSVRPGTVSELCINRPKALNALNAQVLQEMEQALAALRQVPDVRCLIIRGSGERAFVAGADIVAMSALDAAGAADFVALGQRVMLQVEDFAAPTLAMVHGFALGGGCELALACDIVLAADNASFGQPEVGLGLLPGFGGTVRLPKKIGPGHASAWIFSGDRYSAAQAQAVGLVQEVVPAAELEARTQALAHTIASRSPQAVRAAKRLLVHGADTHANMAFEAVSFAHAFTSGDAHEGTQAFVQRREPKFAGI